MAAVVLGIARLCLQPVRATAGAAVAAADGSYENLPTPWAAKPGGWATNPLKAEDRTANGTFYKRRVGQEKPRSLTPPLRRAKELCP